MAIKLGFLVYDSRSGSTLLAKLLTEHFPTMVVTPEIGFDGLLRHDEKWITAASHEHIECALYSKPHFLRNLPLERESVRKLINSRSEHQWTIKELILEIIKEAFGIGDSDGIEWVVIKNGSHFRYLKQILDCFGHDAHFMYLTRDPRAVISSKMTTVRPYFSKETMAWGGVLLAAIRWRRYAQRYLNAKEINAPVLCIKYELLLNEADVVMTEIANSLNCKLAPNESKHRKYGIPHDEQLIHRLVHTDQFHTSNIDMWKNKLRQKDIITIEASLFETMLALGYEPVSDIGKLRRWWLILYALPDMASRVLRHMTRRLLSNSRHSISRDQR